MSRNELMPPQEVYDDIEIADAIESCDTSYAMTPDTSIRIAKEQSSIFEIVRHIKQNRIDITPDFQRYSVWSDLQRSELVESVLMGIPIPMLYLFENEEGLKQVIDGKQRLTAICDFINGNFLLSKLKMLPQYNGLSFQQLPPILQAKFEDCQLQIYIVQPPTPDVVKFYIFDRINRGGTQLNQQEMRHALHQGASTKLLHLIANDERFLFFGIAKSDSSRMQKEYMVLRCLTLYLYASGYIPNPNYTNDINELHSISMKFLNRCDSNFIDYLYNDTVWTLYHVLMTLGENAFKYIESNNRTIISLFEVITLVFSNNEVRQKISNNNVSIAINIINNYKSVIREDKGLYSDYKTVSALASRIQLANKIIEDIKFA
ncbi:DUF262 domain-containing protein [Aliivibrio fischeri]|uniref:DUF262 domain-containing protein n=1 Tax=Aliivibrio fischeri TaxID=668 RepID=UPI001F460C08|nr:DUF262 domain-containing protein [Aliivibrio fischeri]MCE7566223.1 DUF262 domain-containing protein [Aliivibrio fischeri]